MLHFKSAADLQQLDTTNPAFPIVADLVHRLITEYQADGYTYDPDADGWVILVEEHDTDRPLTDIWDADDRLVDLMWEGFTKQDDHFIGVYLANNQWGLAVVIPDEPWLDGELRDVIEENLDPPVESRKTGDLM
ncbi:MAG: hypothetical protein H6955_06360 [Chromatiaceae bacterium]|nr:hypothetical protein [Chromatiaceae bacterium]